MKRNLVDSFRLFDGAPDKAGKGQEAGSWLTSIVADDLPISLRHAEQLLSLAHRVGEDYPMCAGEDIHRMV